MYVSTPLHTWFLTQFIKNKLQDITLEFRKLSQWFNKSFNEA